jgi:choline dehydrogenase-like flavoprotein
VIIPASTIPSDAVLTGDVAVVGAGPVGIATALELADRGLDVIVIESGEETHREAIQQLSDAAEWDSRVHAPMSIAVRRQVGGTSTIWGGRCVPYDRVDFDRRAVTNGVAWPIGYDDLEPYLQRACDWFVCGRATFDATEAGCLPRSIVPELPAGEVSTASLERWSLPTDFGREYRSRLRATQNVRVLVGLTCTRVVCHEIDRRVSHLACQTLHRKPVQVRARRYVIACGGLESTRLLMASPDQHGRAIGDHSGHLGRWYMGHVEGVIANVRFTTPPRRTIFGYERDVDGVYVRRRFSFAGDFQRERGLSNIVAWLANPELADARHRSGPLSLAYLALASPLGPRLAPDAQRMSLTGTKVPGSPYGGSLRSRPSQHLANLAREPLRTLGFAASIGPGRFLPRHRRVPGFFVYNRENLYPFQYHGEHVPRRDSRVTLSESCDALGMARLRIDLRFGADDVDNVVRAHQAWDDFLRRSGRGRLEYLHDDPAEAVWSRVGGGFHQVGTTRMSDCPDDGVVDRDLAVHGFPDLYVASSSVFVTSSQANSTFMTVVFALRLADHLERELRRADDGSLSG